jgi:hypothetical protein
MKARIILYVVVLVIIASCTQQKPKFPQGAWQLVYMHGISGDSIDYKFPGNITGSDVKIWSEGNFNAIGHFKIDTNIINLYSGGVYKLEGNRYEEDILYHFHQDLVGTKNKMLLELRNDTLIQTFPVDDNGQIDKSNYNIEKYVRLK